MTRRVGFAHRDGPMRSNLQRRFTLFDGMFLIAEIRVRLRRVCHLVGSGPVRSLALSGAGLTEPEGHSAAYWVINSVVCGVMVYLLWL